MATQLSYPFTKYLVDGSGGWVGWQLNASAKDIGGGGGVLRAYSLARFPKNKQTNKAKTSVHNRQVLYQTEKKLKRPT